MKHKITPNKDAIIISHVEDISFLSREIDLEQYILIAKESYLPRLLPDITFNRNMYNRLKDGKGELIKRTNFVLYNWFRDSRGKIVKKIEGYTIPMILAQKFGNNFINLIRDFRALNELLTIYDKIFISTNQEQSFLYLASFFPERVILFDPGHSKKYWVTNSLKESWSIGFFPNEHRLSKLARIIQWPFLSLARKNKHILLDDWSSKYLSKKNATLDQNNLNPLKGFYFKKRKVFFDQAKEIFPPELPDNFVSERYLNNFLRSHNIEWDIAEVKVFIRLFNECYKACRDGLMHSYAVFMDLLETYRPETISVPGEAHYAYVILYEMLKKKNIKSQLVLDGYNTVFMPELIYKDDGGGQTLIDSVMGFGRASCKLWHKGGFSQEQITNIRPPFFDVYDKLETTVVKDSYLVMLPYPKNHNPECNYSDKRLYIDEVIAILEKRASVIGIKIKGTFDHFESTEDRHYLEKVFKEQIDRGKIVLEFGLLKDCIGKYENLITPLSTAVAEGLYIGQNVYVYDPYYCGHTDYQVENLEIIDCKHVARERDQFEKMIAEQTPAVLKDKALFDAV